MSQKGLMLCVACEKDCFLSADVKTHVATSSSLLSLYRRADNRPLQTLVGSAVTSVAAAACNDVTKTKSVNISSIAGAACASTVANVRWLASLNLWLVNYWLMLAFTAIMQTLRHYIEQFLTSIQLLIFAMPRSD